MNRLHMNFHLGPEGNMKVHYHSCWVAVVRAEHSGTVEVGTAAGKTVEVADNSAAAAVENITAARAVVEE